MPDLKPKRTGTIQPPSSPVEPTRPSLPSWVTRGPWLLLGAGVAAYFGILLVNPASAEFWNYMGGTVAPFATLFNVLALFAVLRSLLLQTQALAEQKAALELQRRELRLQRKELRLQRKEFRESREVMREQKEQFERTAKAQESLVDAQNRQALAQRAATVVALETALVPVRIEWAKFRMGGNERNFDESMKPVQQGITDLLEIARSEHEALSKLLNGEEP